MPYLNISKGRDIGAKCHTAAADRGGGGGAASHLLWRLPICMDNASTLTRFAAEH